MLQEELRHYGVRSGFESISGVPDRIPGPSRDQRATGSGMPKMSGVVGALYLMLARWQGRPALQPVTLLDRSNSKSKLQFAADNLQVCKAGVSAAKSPACFARLIVIAYQDVSNSREGRSQCRFRVRCYQAFNLVSTRSLFRPRHVLRTLCLRLHVDGIGISAGSWSRSNRVGRSHKIESAWYQRLVVDRSGKQSFSKCTV